MTKNEILHIAIIGGGFCGTMVALNLIHKTTKPLKITLIEKSPNLGTGIAYSTKDPFHLLNVKAEQMGAFAEAPDHFFQWLNLNENLWRKSDPSFKSLSIEPHDYLPRMLYGIYLQNLVEAGQQIAKEKNIFFNHLFKEAVNLQHLSKEIIINFSDSSSLTVDRAVLAIGVSPNKEFLKPDSESPHYISSLWSEKAQTLLKCTKIESSDRQTEVIIIGTGLTMADAMTSLILRGFKGKITAISRTGLISQVHAKQTQLYPKFIDLHTLPRTALGILKIVRREIKNAERKGVDWRDVLNEFRTLIVDIWQLLPWKERKKAVKYLLNIWNYHRHRMPWNYYNEVEKFKYNNKFVLFCGAVVALKAKKKRIEVYVKSKDGESTIFEADYVINCSGPQLNIREHPSILVQNMLKSKVIVPDPLYLGILTKSNGEIKGKKHLYALGQILFGERLETTAVPELRLQCAVIASSILNSDYFYP